MLVNMYREKYILNSFQRVYEGENIGRYLNQNINQNV